MDPETSTGLPEVVKNTVDFGAVNYSVLGSLLVASVGIGLFYGWMGRRKQATMKEEGGQMEEFLLGGKSMGVLPVSLSLMCSFVSSVTILGNPPEVFFYGVQYIWIATGFIPITFALAYIFVPVFFKLQLISAYEYFELRFNKTTRTIMSLTSVVYLILLMSVWVYAPSLALSAVANIDKYISISAIFIVCIFYSSFGGLKAVLWTDALQATVMLGSLAAVVGKGFTDLGGFDKVWEIAEKGNRTDFWNFDPDPRVRHSFWTGTIGGYLMWIPLYAATQSQIQRYLSVPTLKKARMTLIINMFGLCAIILLCFLSGLLLYAKYGHCDPIKAKTIETADQLLPLFVMETLGEYPGLPGLFVAGIAGASLSSVSSALNALSAIVTEDYVKKWRPHYKDAQLAWISKVVCVIGGGLSFGFVFIAEMMGDIFPIALTMVGLFLGPTLGLFTLGMIFPWANAWGSLCGVAGAVAIILALAVGAIVDEDLLPNQKLPLTMDECVYVTPIDFNFTVSQIEVQPHWKDLEYSAWAQFISVAATWYPGIGNLATIALGLIFSFVLKGFQKIEPVKREYFNEHILRMWEKVLPESWIKGWVEPEKEEEKSCERKKGEFV